MHPHSRLWWFVLTVFIFLLLTTALCGAEPKPVPPTAPAQTVVVVTPHPASTPETSEVVPPPHPATTLLVTLLLHVVATVICLRAGMKIFFESAMFGGFCAIVLIDALIVAIMILCASLTDGFTAMLGPQVVVTALVMAVTLHHFGFTKEWFTVMPSVLVTKAFGFFAEVALRMLFLEAILRWVAARGL